MKRVLISIIILLFLVAGISFSVLSRMGEKALEEGILKISELEESLNESTDWGKTSETGPNTVKAEAGTAAGANKPAGSDTKNNNAAILNGNGDNRTTAAAPSNNAGGYTTQSQENGEGQPAADRRKDTKNAVPISEKASLTKLLLSKLTNKDISELKGMLSNGITREEKKRAIEILYSRLTTEDINRIKDAYKKYTQQN